jgi:hypothetical protein
MEDPRVRQPVDGALGDEEDEARRRERNGDDTIDAAGRFVGEVTG